MRGRHLPPVVLAGLLLADVARAQAPVGPRVPEATAPLSASAPVDPLAWRWARFRSVEYAFTVVALGGSIYLRAFADPPGPDASGGILVDNDVKQRASIQNLKLRGHVAIMTDVFFYGSMGYRLADSAIAPTFVLGRSDLALQLSMIDLEAFGLVAALLWGPQALVGRERPFVDRCHDPKFASKEGGCDPNGAEHNRSFFAGHPAVVMAAAGLTCTHHRHLPLYGGGAGETLACGLMIGAAGLTGVGRVVTGKHYVSDLVVGFGVGAFAGFALPELLHYRFAKPRVPVAKSAEPPPAVRAALVPSLSPGQLGLGLNGSF